MTAVKAKRKTGTKKTARELYGEAFKALGEQKYEKAATGFQKIIASFPDEQEVLAKARTYQRTCQRALAMKKRKKPLKSAEEHFDAGVFHHNNRNFDDAVAHFEKALKISKDSAHVYYAWAATQVQQGDLEEGLETLKKAAKIDETSLCYAINDPDFEPLAGHEGFRELTEAKG